MTASEVEFHRAVDVEVKFVPLRVMVKAAPPARVKAGLRLAITGGGGLMAKLLPEELPVMLPTVMLAAPTLAIRLAETETVNCEALTYVAGSAVAPQFAVAVVVKFVPLMVSVKSSPPAIAEAGLRLVMAGAGGLTVKVAAGETPPVVLTVTLAVPTLAIRLDGMATFSCVTLL